MYALRPGEHVIPSPTGTGKPPPAGARVWVGENFKKTVEKLSEQISSLEEHDEWEMKIGFQGQASFDSGLTKAQLGRIIKWAQTESKRPNSNVTSLSGNKWMESSDLFYLNGIRVTMVKVKDEQGNEVPMVKETIKKTKKSDMDIGISGHSITIRSSVKEERPAIVQFRENPELIRLKKRLSYVYKNCISVDITIVWQGKTEEECNGPQKFEIELEFLDKALIRSQGVTWAAESMLLKAIFLINEAYQTECNYETLTLHSTSIQRCV